MTISTARQRELSAFVINPGDPKYDAAEVADRVRKEQEKRQARLGRKFIDVRTRWHLAGHGGSSLVTLVLIGICGLVAAASGLGERPEPVLKWLYFGNPVTDASGLPVLPPEVRREIEKQLERVKEEPPDAPGMERFQEELEEAMARSSGVWGRWQYIPELRRGQLWRLVTPIFIHYGILHLVFNLFWLRDLGSAIEGRKGWLWLLMIVLVTAVLSNVGQFAWSGWPHFGGMSGVVYGLFGYCWIKARLQPHEQFWLDSQTVTIMLAWLVLCMTGYLGPIANAAHVVGLIVGCAFAYGAYLSPKVRRAIAGR